MCLRDQVVDNDGGVVILIQACVLSNNDGGVGRGGGISDVSEGSETTTKAVGRDDRTKESMKTTEASDEEDEHEEYNNSNGCVGKG